MTNLSLMRTIVRELLTRRPFEREPEPELVMDDAEQVAAYSEAGRIDGIMAAAYLFHSARASQVIGANARNVLDLACGPATQLIQIAELNPQVHFTGVDLSEPMLASAREYARARGVENVSFQSSDITSLGRFRSGEFDAVISTMALHHLPTEEFLSECFREISRVLRPDGAVYLTDFSRLRSLESVRHFAYLNAAHQPEIFSLDYELSLRAAFHLDDLRARLPLLPGSVKLIKTFLIPILVIIETPPRPLPASTVANLAKLRAALPERYRSDLEQMRLFLRLGGLRADPFSTRTTERTMPT